MHQSFHPSGSTIIRRRPVTLSVVGVVMLCAVIWGGQSVAVKQAVAELPPYRVMTLRFLFACLVTGSFAIVSRQSLRLGREQIVMVLLNALFLFTQVGLFTVGTSWTTSVQSIVIISSFPFFTAIACHYFLPHFPFTWHTISGLVIAFSGVLVVFGSQLSLPNRGEIRGDMLVLLAAAVMGVKITYVKSLLGRIRPLQIVFWEAIAALPLFFLTSLWFEGTDPWRLSTPAMVAVLYQGCLVSGVAFLLWTTLLSRHSPNDVAVFRMATPLVGMLLGWLILDESVSRYLLTGGVLIALGIYRVTR